MPPISRLTDGVVTGHICATWTTMAKTTNVNVFATGMPIVRQMDQTAFHAFPPKPPCAPHIGVVNVGVLNVLVFGGMPCGTVNKSTDMGFLATGAPTVWAGGGSDFAGPGF